MATPGASRKGTPNPVRGLLYEGSVRRQRTVWFYVFVSPWIVGFLLWHALPMLASLALSFTRYDAIAAPRFIGPQNYADMVADPLTWQSLKVTAVYTVGAVGVTLVGSLVLAALFNVFGIHGPRWFTDQTWVVPSFILMASWSVGGPMLIYLAAMQNVPTQVH